MNIPKDELEKLLHDAEKSKEVLLSLFEDQNLKINKLKESRHKYESLFENSPVSLWEEDLSAVKKYVDKNFPDKTLLENFLNNNPDKIAQLIAMVKVVNVNQATLKLYKANTNEELYQNFDKIFTINSIDVFKRLIINIINSVYEYETESVNKNLKGENFYIKIKYSVISGFEDTWERIIVSVVDITQEKQIKEQLQQSEQRFIEAQAIAHYGNWHIDYTKNKVLRSQEIFNILEIDEKELKPTLEAFLPYIHEDDLKKYQEIFEESIRKKTAYEYEFRIITTTGKQKYVIEKGCTFCNENDEPIRSVGTLQDITDKRLTELKLEESKLQYEVLFDSAPIALFEEDFTEVIKVLYTIGGRPDNIKELLEDPQLLEQCMQLVFVNNVNREALQLFNATDKAHFHQILPNLFTKNALKVLKNIFIDITQGHKSQSYETILRKTDGELFHALVRFSVLNYSKESGKLIFSVENISLRKKLLAEIEEKQLNLNQAQQIALIGSFTLNHKDNSISRTDEFYRIFETTPEELPTREECFLNYVHLDDRDHLVDIFHNSIKNRQPYEIQYRIITGKGHLKYINEKGNTYLNDKGEPYKTIGTLQDITDKILFENELDKSRKKLENTFFNMTDGFVHINTDFEYTYVNPQATHFLKRPAEKLVGFKIWEVFPDVKNTIFQQKCEEVIKKGKPLVYEEFFKENNRWFENRIYPSTDGISIFFNDITERKNSETKTKEALNVIVNSNSIAIVWKNTPTWPIKYVSENIERILGYTAEEMTDEIVHFSKIMHPDDLEKSNNEAFLNLNNTKTEDYTLSPYRVYTKNGKIRWIAERTKVTRNEQGEAIELRGFIDDITEQYQLENAINNILSAVSKLTGEEYLKEITLQLANVLGAEHTFIGLNDKENPLLINTLYNCFNNEIVDNFSYLLEGTPCAEVLNLEACSFPNNVANLFPEDVLLKDMEIEGYVGVPLIDSKNSAIGVMVALYKSSIENPHFSESIIQLFSTRTTAEIERLRTNSILKETESIFNLQLKKLNSAIDSVKDVVFMTDTNGIFTYVNEYFTKLYGYEANEVIGKVTPRILKGGLLDHSNYQSLWSALLNKKPFILEIKNKKKNGELINIETSLSSIIDDNGAIIGFIAIQRDITEKIKQNNLIEQSEKKYRDLFEKSGDANLIIKNNTFIDCNEAALKMVGFKGAKQDFLNVHPSTLSPVIQPDGTPSFEKAENMMTLAKEKGTHIFEWIHLKSDGTPFFAEVTLTHIVSEVEDEIIHVTWRDITSKKSAEEHLKISEEEGWALFENSPNLIWVEDYSKIKHRFDELKKEGIGNLRSYLDQYPEEIKNFAGLVEVKKVNKRSLDFYGVKTKEELLRNISDFFVPESYDLYKEELISLFNGNLSYSSETPIRKLNGQIAYLALNVTIPETNKENLDKVIISFSDITEQKRIAQTKEILLNITKQISEVSSMELFSEIVKNELGKLLDTSNFYIAIYNKEKDTISIPYYTDDLDEEFFGINEFEAEGTMTKYVIKTKKPLLANIEQIKSLEEAGKIKLVGSDSKIWLGVPLFSKEVAIGAIAVQSYTNEFAYDENDQKILEIVSEQVAITIERIKHQNEIKENEEKFRSIFELSPDMVLVINIEGKIVDCNDIVLKSIQYSHKDQIIGRSITDVFRKDPNQRAIDVFKSIIDGDELSNKELDFQQNDGNFITVEVSGTFIKNEKPEDCLILAVGRDITIRKQHELEITNALEKAREADRLKSSFLANMSHEIRTPMNGIIGFAEMLQNNNLDDEKRSFYANIIMNSSRQLLSIINDVLDMSTIEAGLVEIKKEAVSINKMLSELHEFFIQRSDVKGIKLIKELTLDNDLAVINTDSTKVQQILTNFISNAIKFTQKGSVTFGYQLKNEFLEFYVTDTGIGIDKESHDKVFERFRQVNMEYTRETIGNGLGLSISKKLVEVLGGEIWLESEPNVGSTFYFTLPYQHDVLTIKEEHSTQTTFRAMNEEITILLAEDEEYNRIFIEEILDDKNFTILTAENGVQAVDIAKNHPEIQFILMDIKMPVMNGIEASKAIKEFNKEVPIIALTAFSMESDKTHLINQGFNDYVAKPIVKRDLMQIIEKYAQKI